MTIAAVLIAGILAQGPGAGAAPRQPADLAGAAKLGDLARVRELVGGGAVVDAADRRGYTALMWAAAAGSLEVTTYLLERGARVDARGLDGATALYFAAANGASQVVKLLLARGANPASMRDGRTPRQAALARGQAETAALLEQAESSGAGNRSGLPVATSAFAPAPPPPISDTLRALDGILGGMPAVTGQAGEARRRAVAALSDLQALSAKWPADSPEDYRANLANTAAALGDAVARKDPALAGEALAAAADDLEAKLEHCRASGGRLGGSVLVRVRTVQGSAEAGKWQVFYMPKILEVSPSASADLFPQLSSPTEELIVPGRYLMWVRNPATSALGERTVVKIGEGRNELMVDLPVPASSAK